jgi:hypothetical protein
MRVNLCKNYVGYVQYTIRQVFFVLNDRSFTEPAKAIGPIILVTSYGCQNWFLAVCLKMA